MPPFQYTPIDFSQYEPRSYYPELAMDPSGYYAGQEAVASGAAGAGGIGQKAGGIVGVLGGKYLGGKAVGAAKGALGIGTAGAATTAGAAPIAATAGGAAGAGVTAPLTFAGGSAGAFGTGAGAAPAVPTILGAETAGAGATAAAPGLGLLGTAGLAAGAGLVAYGANQGANKLLGGQANKPLGLLAKGAIPVVGPALLAASLADKLFGSGKGKDQRDRDQVRKALIEQGRLGTDYKLNLPDGKSFDIGKDGGNFHDYSDIDFKQEGIKDIVAAANPLGVAISGGDQKLESDFTGYFVRAATDKQTNLKDAFSNIRAEAAQLKLDPATLHQTIDSLKDKFTEEETKIYHANIDNLYNGYYDQKAKSYY